MRRLPELPDDPQLVARRFYTRMRHPLLRHELPAEARCALFSRLPDPPLRPAPLLGQDTAGICAELLSLDGERVRELLGSGVLHATDPAALP